MSDSNACYNCEKEYALFIVCDEKDCMMNNIKLSLCYLCFNAHMKTSHNKTEELVNNCCVFCKNHFYTKTTIVDFCSDSCIDEYMKRI